MAKTAEEYLDRIKNGAPMDVVCQSIIANDDWVVLPRLLSEMYELGRKDAFDQVNKEPCLYC